MPVRNVDPYSPIERVSDVEREPGAAEHENEKRHNRIRRPPRHSGQSHHETTDTWCNSEEGEEQEVKPETREASSNESSDDNSTAIPKLDYKA